MEQQWPSPDAVFPANMEILVADKSQYRDSNQSVCSLHSLVSGDNDSLLLDDEVASPILQQEQSDPDLMLHRRFSSQPSISTEMAIIASSSPEIKALSNQPITPCFPQELNFELTQQENGTDGVDKQQARTSFVSPLPAMTVDHIHDNINEKARKRNSHEDWSVATGASSSIQHPLETRMNEPDELALYLQRQSLEMDVVSTPAVVGEQKENVSPPFSFDCRTPEASNRSSSGSAYTFKSALRKETRRQHSLSSMMGSNKRRPSLHRRVSFNSLPSPAEIIASPEGRLPPQVNTTNSKLNVPPPPGKSPLAMDFPLC